MSKTEFGSGVVTTSPTPAIVDLELDDTKVEKEARIQLLNENLKSDGINLDTMSLLNTGTPDEHFTS